MSLQEFHRAFPGGVRWRLTAAGVDVEGSGVERTTGAPATVTRIWDTWSREINATARARRVPCALIVATIATESGGKADAVRLEPGYRSDEDTPHKVSPGLMQTLISTAREAMLLSCDRTWLLEPANSSASARDHALDRDGLAVLGAERKSRPRDFVANRI
jgi:Transglycosylase SLT domain